MARSLVSSVNDCWLWRVMLTVLYLAHITDASCHPDNFIECRQAANAGEVDKLQAGGQCTAKPYASFTHVCTVTRYVAGVDYCCCSDVSQAMCCTYQQSFQQFRCIHSEDAIALTRSWWAEWQVPVLLVVTLVPLVICVVVVVVCVIRCVHRRRTKKHVIHYTLCLHPLPTAEHDTPSRGPCCQYQALPSDVHASPSVVCNVSKWSPYHSASPALYVFTDLSPPPPPYTEPSAPPLLADSDAAIVQTNVTTVLHHDTACDSRRASVYSKSDDDEHSDLDTTHATPSVPYDV